MPLYTFVDNAVPTSSQWNANLRDQVITQCTSGTRPASPVEGQHIDESDTERLMRYNGSAWVIRSEPVQTWTPTVTQSASVTVTVTRAIYQRHDGLWWAKARLTVTGSGTAANNVSISTPFTMANANDSGGSFFIYDNSAGFFYAGHVAPSSTTAVILQSGAGVTGYFGVTPAVTLAANDIIDIDMCGTY